MLAPLDRYLTRHVAPLPRRIAYPLIFTVSAAGWSLVGIWFVRLLGL
jgi:hypothetical protein